MGKTVSPPTSGKEKRHQRAGFELKYSVSMWIQPRKAEKNQVPVRTEAQSLVRSRLELKDTSMMQLSTDLTVCSES